MLPGSHQCQEVAQGSQGLQALPPEVSQEEQEHLQGCQQVHPQQPPQCHTISLSMRSAETRRVLLAQCTLQTQALQVKLASQASPEMMLPGSHQGREVARG